MFDAAAITAPIPGMSLTTEPGNRPWENPPQLTTVEEAIDYYTDKLLDPAKADAVLYPISLGVSIEAAADAITTSSVMNGIHTIDVSVLVSPVVYEMLRYVCDINDMEYVESYEEENKKQQLPAHEIRAIVQEAADSMRSKGVKEESVEPDIMRRGLMTRPSRMMSPMEGEL